METKFHMLKEVLPVGTLTYLRKEFWLLSPTPIEPDWEEKGKGVVNLYRFSVVPKAVTQWVTDPKTGKKVYYYPHARHLVISTGFYIEYQIIESKIWIIDSDWLLSALGEQDNG